jgi:hypothetical protein
MECPKDLFEQMILRLQALADLVYDEAKMEISLFKRCWRKDIGISI